MTTNVVLITFALFTRLPLFAFILFVGYAFPFCFAFGYARAFTHHVGFVTFICCAHSCYVDLLRLFTLFRFYVDCYVVTFRWICVTLVTLYVTRLDCGLPVTHLVCRDFGLHWFGCALLHAHTRCYAFDFVGWTRTFCGAARLILFCGSCYFTLIALYTLHCVCVWFHWTFPLRSSCGLVGGCTRVCARVAAHAVITGYVAHILRLPRCTGYTH